MIPWPRIDALRTVLFYEVSILGKTPLGRKLQPPDLCGSKIIKSWYSTSQSRKEVRLVKQFELYSVNNYSQKIFSLNSVINNWEKRCLESFIQSEPHDSCYQLFGVFFKHINRESHWYTTYTRKVKEAIHTRLSPNSINRDNGAEIPEAWMPTIKNIETNDAQKTSERLRKPWYMETIAGLKCTNHNRPPWYIKPCQNQSTSSPEEDLQ